MSISIQSEQLQRLWNGLVACARRLGVRYEEAEELTSDALMKGLDCYDPARGDFEPFVRTILRNMVYNYLRKSLNDEGDIPFEDDNDQEEQAMLERIHQQLLNVHPEEERTFYTAYLAWMATAERATVSEAARRIGKTPQQGWDILRRIRHKAETIRAAVLDEVEMRPSVA
ncbi:MAG: hypothetical protein C4326_04445 [Ignavibacteria bacterium]